MLGLLLFIILIIIICAGEMGWAPVLITLIFCIIAGFIIGVIRNK